MDNPWFYFIYDGRLLTVINDYQSGNNPIYVGQAQPGSSLSNASWRICLLTYNANGGVTNVQWSPLAANFGDIWSNRASLTYN